MKTIYATRKAGNSLLGEANLNMNKVERLHKMPACLCARRAAAEEDRLYLKMACSDPVGFKKLDGKKRNLRVMTDFGRPDTQIIREIFINQIIFVLKMKYLQRCVVKRLRRVDVKYFIFR